ncbi:hypothetical protein [Leucothrix pacifica]|uniref:DUF11 domain-containing protein n=1 Tax=Leucothrix pacifica TaxID=1247513 RepID=A0A317C7U8_9GAMM|nr:hypothetical protein [Leucothrix pacifica]PWQ92192.1 hypothetical protein DKW60_22465 [Leucothrix pacifica]
MLRTLKTSIGSYNAVYLASSFLLTMNAWGAGTPAGTAIHNHVEVSYQVGDDPNVLHTEKADHSFVVSELIRSNVSALEPQGIGTATPAQNAVLSYQVTNTGNGQESFLLTTEAGLPDQFQPEVTGLWIETNGQPGWQADDTLYVPTSGGIPLAADQSETVYVVSDIPADIEDESRSDVALVSTAATTKANLELAGGSLPTGGDGGIEAVIAQDNAKHQDSSHYTVSTVKVDVEKSIVSISDPYGGELSMPGSEVTYKIRVVASGSGTANDLVIEDAVPESMNYKLNSLKMNGSHLTDHSDSDTGWFDDLQRIAFFTPGTIVAPATHEYTLTYIIE